MSTQIRNRIISRLATLILAGSIAALIPAPSTQAENRYWDGGTGNIVTNGDGISAGTTGRWDTILLNWDAGAAPHVAWSNANNDTAVFGGTAGTVSLDENITVGGLTFTTTGYNITTGANTLSFGAVNNTISFNNIAAASITGTVGGSGNVILTALNPATAGTLTLNGTSSGGWSGTTTINAGMTLALAASNQALLTTTGGITLNGGGITLTNVNSTEGALNRVSDSAGITSNGGTFTYTNTSGNTYAETIGSVDLVRGQLIFAETTNMAAGSQTLTVSGLTRTGATNTSVVSFGSASGLNTTTNIIRVTGATGTGTGSGQIIGPWAFYGTTPASPTDYAVYDASGRVLNASITATAENAGSWVSGANVTLGGATTLTATRTVNSLRYTGGALALDLGASNFGLQTYGLLNGGSGTLTVSTTGTGGLTTPTGGGNLYLTAGAAAMTVSVPINDNGGAVTLVKSGSSTLTLSGTNAYTGGTVVNAGTLSLTGSIDSGAGVTVLGTAVFSGAGSISGSGAFTHSSTGSSTLGGTNSYSGGTVINAGIVSVTADTNLGNSNGKVTLNGGRLLVNAANLTTARVFEIGASGGLISVSGNNNMTSSGRLTGSGVFTMVDPGGGGNKNINFNAVNNDFTGGIIINQTGSSSGSTFLTVNSLLDSSNNIAFNGIGTSPTPSFIYGTGAITGLLLNSRAFELNSAGSLNATIQNNNTTYGITIGTDLVATGAGAKTLTLGAVAGPTNVFSGAISDGIGGGTVTVAKTGAGTWSISGNMSQSAGISVGGSGTLALSGTNTYSGITDLLASSTTGVLILQGSQSLSTNTSKIQFAQNSSNVTSLRLLDDGAGTISFNKPIEFGGGNTSQSLNLFVGNNNTSNGGNSAGTTSGSTIQVGSITFTSTATDTATTTINATSSSGYRLQTGTITLNNLVTRTAGATTVTALNPTTANMTVAAVTMATGNTGIANDGVPVVRLDGTSSDNYVSGAISNASDGPGFGSGQALSLQKQNSSVWTLQGTNTYTGTTAISGGLLRFTGNSSAVNGAVSVSGGALGGNGGSLGGAVTVSSTGGINLADGSVGSLTLGSTLAITGAAGANNLYFDLGNATNATDKLIVGGATSVTNAGAAVITLNQLNGVAGRNTAGTYTLIQGTTSMATVGQFALGTNKAFGQTFALGVSGNDLQLTTTQVTSATPAAFWKGGANNWSTATNWNSTVAGGGAAGAAPDYQTNVTFSTTSPAPANLTTNVLDVDFDINSLTFNAAAGVVTIGGTTKMLTIEATNANGNTAGNGITSSNSSGENTISAKVGLASDQTWTVASGGTLTVQGVITDFSGNRTLTKQGAGLLYIGKAAPVTNTFTNLTINGGVVQGGGNSNSNANFGTGNVTLNGGVLELYFGGSLTRTLGGVGTNNSIQITGGISGFSGQGTSAATFTLNNDANYELIWGSTNFDPSQFVLQSGSPAVGSGGQGILANKIDLNGANRTIRSDQPTTDILNGYGTFSGAIRNSSGTAAGLLKEGVGQTILSGVNAYDGGTTINNGILRFASLTAMPASGAVSVSNGATLGITVNTGVWVGGTGNGTIAGLTAGLGGQAGSTVSFNGNSSLLLNVTGNITESNAITNGGATNLSLIKIGGSTLALAGTNTYTGNTTLTQGTLSVGASANLGAAASNLVFNGGTLRITGTTLTNFSGIGHTVSFTSGQAVGLDINDAANTFTADQVLNQGAGTLTVAGLGTLVLDQTNTFTGATSTSGGGRLVLDYGTNDTSKLSDTTALTLGGGTLTLKGATGSHVEVVSATSLSAGGTFLTRDGANTAKLRMNVITRAAGGTISFASGTIADTDTNNVNSILGGWATLGNDWAVSVNSSAANTAITALSSYTGAMPSSGAGANTANYTLSGPQTQTSSILANTVKITGTGTGDTLDLGVNNLTTTYSSATSLGGILYVGGGDDNYNITGSGTLIPGTNAGELIITTTTGALNISTPIIGGGAGILTKAGAGRLVLNTASTFTGIVRVNQGVLRLANATASGTPAGGIVVQNDAALELTGGITVGAEALTIAGSGVSNGGALRNIAGSDNTYQGAITIGNGGARINAESGTILNVRGITTTLNADVTFGGAGDVTHSTTAISGTGGVIKDGAGALNLNFANTYTGGTFVNNGTVKYGVANALADTGLVTVNGGTFDIQTFSDSVGAVTLISGNINGTSGVLTGTSYDVRSGSASAILGGTGTLTKTTGGTATLAGANTYTGATAVNEGTLIVSGSLSGTTAVSVAGTATLATDASASIGTAAAGNVAITGNLAPGGSTAGADAGTLNLSLGTGGKLNFAAGSKLLFGLGTTSDLVAFNSNGDWLSGSGNASLQLDVSLAGFNYASTYTVFSNVTTDGFTFANITGYDAMNWTANFFDAGSSYQLSFVQVPEPNVAVSLLGGLGMLVGLRRLRRASHGLSRRDAGKGGQDI